MKILIVAHNDDSRRLLALSFSLEGYDVIVAKDGGEGLTKALEEKPDVIVTGLQMQTMSGVEMIQRLRQQPELEYLKIIVLTAQDASHAKAARQAGAHIVLHKPLAFDSLNDIVKHVVK